MATVQAGVNLGPDPDSLIHLCECHLRAHAENRPNDLMADSKRVGHLAPIAASGVHVTCTHPTAFYLDIDIVISKGSRLPSTFLKIEPFFSAWNLEPTKFLGIRHGGDRSEMCFCTEAIELEVQWRLGRFGIMRMSMDTTSASARERSMALNLIR